MCTTRTIPPCLLIERHRRQSPVFTRTKNNRAKDRLQFDHPYFLLFHLCASQVHTGHVKKQQTKWVLKKTPANEWRAFFSNLFEIFVDLGEALDSPLDLAEETWIFSIKFLQWSTVIGWLGWILELFMYQTQNEGMKNPTHVWRMNGTKHLLWTEVHYFWLGQDLVMILIQLLMMDESIKLETL